MTGLIQLKGCTAQLNTALTDLTAYCKQSTNTSNGDGESTPCPLIHPDSPVEAHEARRRVLTNIAQLQILLTEPADLLQELALKNQILACISWLGEFQVLACIPLQGDVPTKDVAEIIGVPETQLRRVVHLTATAAGFLQEPRPGHIAHSALTAPFVARPSYLDAVTFLSDMAAPAALHMARATQRFGESERESESARNAAFNTDSTFAEMCERQSKLQRQWPAYQHHALGGDGEAGADDVAACFDWRSLGTATVVEIGAQSITTALALATLNPSLRITIQMNSESPPSSLSASNLANLTSSSITNGNTVSFAGQGSHGFSNINGSTPANASIYANPHYGAPSLNNNTSSHSNGLNGTNGNGSNGISGNGTNGANGTTSYDSFSLTKNITIEKRHPASPQPIEDAAVYILHLPSTSITHSSSSSSSSSSFLSSADIVAELRTHLPILRANIRSRILLITPRMLSESGGEAYSADAAAASLRDLTLLQLCNDHSMGVMELRDLVHRVSGGGDGDNGADHPLVVLGELRNGRGGVVGVEVGCRAGSGYDG